MKVLVLNCGSSSIKYQLHDAATHSALARGLVSRIGEEGARIDAQTGDLKQSREVPIPDSRPGPRADPGVAPRPADRSGAGPVRGVGGRVIGSCTEGASSALPPF